MVARELLGILGQIVIVILEQTVAGLGKGIGAPCQEFPREASRTDTADPTKTASDASHLSLAVPAARASLC